MQRWAGLTCSLPRSAPRAGAASVLARRKRLPSYVQPIHAILTHRRQNEALDLTRRTNFQDKSVTWMHRPGVLPSLVAEPDAPIELDRLKDELAVIGGEKCGWHVLSWVALICVRCIYATRRAALRSPQAAVLSIRAGGARLRGYAWACPLPSARLRGWDEEATMPRPSPSNNEYRRSLRSQLFPAQLITTNPPLLGRSHRAEHLLRSFPHPTQARANISALA